MLNHGLRTWRISGETLRSSLRCIFQVRLHSGAAVSSGAASELTTLSTLNEQRGDTIVEVMIAIVVVSMVLVAAYVTTTHNINGLQDTQEHSQALQLAQTQLEYLHNSSTEPSDHQCFNTSGGITSGASCKVDASGAPTTAQPQFKVDITNDNPPTFQVTVTWASLDNGGVTNNVTLYYQP